MYPFLLSTLADPWLPHERRAGEIELRRPAAMLIVDRLRGATCHDHTERGV